MDEQQTQKPSPMSNSGLSNLSKRQQVSKANRMIFVWVAVAAVVIVSCVVVAFFLGRQALFNQKVINQKALTNKTIVQNVDTAKELKKNIDLLLADENLAKVKASPDDNNLKVIFDALPTTGDNTTLTNSLFSHVFSKAGVTTDSISVGSSVATGITPVATALPAPNAAGSAAAPQPEAIPLLTSISGNKASIAQALKNLEVVIRPMNISIMSMEVNTDNVFKVTLTGESYFVAPDSVKLGKVEVKP